ncbi:MAG: hypothetical protein ACLFPS_05995 [Clostridia bacterium]
MIGLYIVTIVMSVVSLVISKEKTIKGYKIGWKKFNKILPNYLKLLILIAVVLFFTEDLIVKYLAGNQPFIGLGLSVFLGSITMMPGFIAYPLAGILVSKGVPYMVVAGFVTSLMMVGVLTYPVEKEYFGVKGTIYRNIVSVVISIIIAISTGVFYGELF